MKRILLVLSLMSLLMTSGCAVFNEDNTPTLNWSEKHLVPDSPGAQLATAPLTVPAGLTAVTIDAVIVNPAMVIDDAGQDVGELLWDDLEWRDHYVTECAFLPLRTASTPPAFSLVFIGRACFDIDDRVEKRERDDENDRKKRRREQKKRRAKAHIKKGYEALNEGDFNRALEEAERADEIGHGQHDILKAQVHLEADRYAKMVEVLHTKFHYTFYRHADIWRNDRFTTKLFSTLRNAEPGKQIRLMIALQHLHLPQKLIQDDRFISAINKIADDGNDFVVLQALNFLNIWTRPDSREQYTYELPPALYAIIDEQRSSDNPLLSAAAQAIKKSVPAPEKPGEDK